MTVFFQVLFRVLTSSDLWQTTLQFGALLLLPALGGVISERSGVVNIAMEGMMLTGAYAGVMVALSSNKLLLGLLLGAVGENQQVADPAGVNVRLVRSLCVISSGLLSGLAGAFLALGINGIFIWNMTAGAGYIALAAMIFGKYTPLGTAGACLIFGLGEALSVRMQDSGVSPYLLSTIPYILTLIPLVGLVGRTIAPAADGIPYEPGAE